MRRSGATRANYVISGIPFSTMPAASAKLFSTRPALCSNLLGLFLGVSILPQGTLGDLRRIFRDVTLGFYFLNVLPAHLYFARPVSESDGD